MQRFSLATRNRHFSVDIQLGYSVRNNSAAYRDQKQPRLSESAVTRRQLETRPWQVFVSTNENTVESPTSFIESPTSEPHHATISCRCLACLTHLHDIPLHCLSTEHCGHRL